MNHHLEVPKDYSCEDVPPPVPAARVTGHRKVIGYSVPRRHLESGGIDPIELMSKLQNLDDELHRQKALKSLRQHHSVWSRRRQENRITYKFYLTYISMNYNGRHDRDTYIVRGQSNTLRELKARLPMKGSYRYFFTTAGEGNEEIEDDDAALPYIERDGNLSIYCHLFPTN